MDVEAIQTLAQLEKLRPEWQDLWERCPTSTPFQHPEWLLPWWNTFGTGDLFSFAVRDGGRLAALAPQFLHSRNGRREVAFIGNGVSDYSDILVDPVHPTFGDSACSAILAAMARQGHRWDVCDLQDLRSVSPLLDLPIPAGVQTEIQPQCLCSLVSLPETVEQFRAGLPHGLRRNLRRYRSQLQAEGSVAFETAGCGQYQDHLDALFSLHRARWRVKDGPGVLSGPGIERFHRTSARQLWKRGLVRLHALRFNGAIAAIVYALMHRGRTYSYLGGFHPALSRFSPGSLIMAYTMEQAIREGVREFDFLRGGEAYKSGWGAKPQRTSRLLIWHRPQPPCKVFQQNALAPAGTV